MIPHLNEILFLDIETASQKSNYFDLDPRGRKLWFDKYYDSEKDRSLEDSYSRKAALYPEFGKVICVTVASLWQLENGELEKKELTFADNDEERLLTNLANFLFSEVGLHYSHLCAHNGKGFDFPYLAKRMIINSVQVPPCLLLAGKKPWEVPHLDTMEYWRFGSFKGGESLDRIAYALGIPSPKNNLSGDLVSEVYHAGGLPDIMSYCENDVRCLMRVAGRLFFNRTLN
jgi:predicted PolB exonuclease-like 3'-5' exonuclease